MTPIQDAEKTGHYSSVFIPVPTRKLPKKPVNVSKKVNGNKIPYLTQFPIEYQHKYNSSLDMNQAFIQEHLKLFDSANQWVLATRNDQTVVINTFSFDQFHPYRLLTNHHRKQCRTYEARQQYALPSTPKIILMSKSSKLDEEVLLLAQRGQFQFQKLVSHYQSSQRGHLDLTLQIVLVAEMLQKKYGYFKFTQGMIRSSKGPTLLVWISQNQASNQPQFPIDPIFPINLSKPNKQTIFQRDPMRIMINSLYEVLNKKISNNILGEILRQQVQGLNFEYLKKRITQSMKQKLFSHCTIITSDSDKYRRYTQEKRRKIPDFLLNKTNLRQKQKQKQKEISQHQQSNYNIKSNLTYTTQQNKVLLQDQYKVRQFEFVTPTSGNQSQIQKQRKIMLLSLLNKNSENKIILQDAINTVSVSQQSIKVDEDCIRLIPPFETPLPEIKQELFRKQEKTPIRQSGKSVSTSSANYFSINSSGKRFYLTSTLADDETGTCLKNKYMSSDLIYPKKTSKCGKKDRSSFYKQCKPQIQVSKIIQQNHEEVHVQSQSQSQSGRSPRSPSILHTLGYPQIITQQSLASPSSEFYKDVDKLLHSQAISPKMSSQIDNTIEGELNNILFD